MKAILTVLRICWYSLNLCTKEEGISLIFKIQGRGGIMKKRIKIIVIIAVIALILFGIYSLARFIVSQGYSSLAVVQEEAAEREEAEREGLVDITDQREYLDDGTGSEIQRVDVLFDTKDLLDRQREYLGDDYSKYEDLLNVIEDNYASVFESIDYSRPDDYTIDETCIGGANDFSVGMLEDGLNVQINSSLTIIGLYDDYCVVYANGYPYLPSTELIVVDYEDASFNTNASKLMDFGDVCSLQILQGSYVVDDTNSLPIIYVKE